ncbi:MAG: glutaminyl-peptide cyclotransferase, partial [Dinghuibacter sp.]|nr:glutaminyl-peptide cyclotransferase [Dinghuibacter sp.]
MKTKIILAVVVLAAAAFIYYAVSGTGKPPGENGTQPPVKNTPLLNISQPPLNTYPHDTACYTEGMEFYQGKLYESAGELGRSFVAAYDYKTGKLLKKQKLADDIFGEGITILNNKLYMLTWKNKQMLVFDPVTLKQTG